MPLFLRPVFWKRSLLQFATFLAWHLLRPVVARAPERWLPRLGRCAGTLLHLASPGKRALFLREAARVAQDTPASPAVQALARRSMDYFCARQLAALRFDTLLSASSGPSTRITGLEHVRAALAKGRGGVLLTAHFGAFLEGPIALSCQGFAVTQLAGSPRTQNMGYFGRKVFAARQRVTDALPLDFFPVEASLKSVLQQLKQNRLLVIAFDGREGSRWHQAPFLGQTASFSPGPFRIAEKRNAPVLPCVTLSRPDGGRTVIIEAPLPLLRTQDGALDEQAMIRAFASKLERYVSRNPEQYVPTLVSHQVNLAQGRVQAPIFEADIADHRAENPAENRAENR